MYPTLHTGVDVKSTKATTARSKGQNKVLSRRDPRVGKARLVLHYEVHWDYIDISS